MADYCTTARNLQDKRKAQIVVHNIAESRMQQFQVCTQYITFSAKFFSSPDPENFSKMLISSHHAAWRPSFADGQIGPFSLLHGSEGELQCKPSAEPRPTFQWLRNGVLISYGENSRYTLQKDGTLVIKKVEKDMDSVNYTCKAQNMMGQDSATAVPVVLGKISSCCTLR